MGNATSCSASAISLGVIPDGVNFDVFFRESDSHEEAGHIKILMPYSPALLKGFNDGLEAFKLIKARCPDAHFAIFGRKKLVNPELRKMPEWIEFHNISSDAQLRALSVPMTKTSSFPAACELTAGPVVGASCPLRDSQATCDTMGDPTGTAEGVAADRIAFCARDAGMRRRLFHYNETYKVYTAQDKSLAL